MVARKSKGTFAREPAVVQLAQQVVRLAQERKVVVDGPLHAANVFKAYRPAARARSARVAPPACPDPAKGQRNCRSPRSTCQGEQGASIPPVPRAEQRQVAHDGPAHDAQGEQGP